VNQILEFIFQLGLLKYRIVDISSSDIDDYYLKLFLINSLDTNLISIFIPEIWQYSKSEFVDRDSNGKVLTNSTFPCEIFLSAYKEAPEIAFTKEAFTLKAFIKIDVDCKNTQGVMKQVVEIETSTDMAYSIVMTEDLLVKMQVQNFQL
jgi:hypothetical protein